MTIRQAVRRKVLRALGVAVAFLLAISLVYAFTKHASWAWISVLFMLGFMGAMLYIVWLVDCPRCHASFGQHHIFNAAFNLSPLADSKFCPHCKIDLDASLPGL